jgi:hypothetical protein
MTSSLRSRYVIELTGQVQMSESKPGEVVAPPAVRQRAILGVLIREITRKVERTTALAAEVKTMLIMCCRSSHVGKAGKTLRVRCNQHEGGFKGGSAKGVRNAEYLMEFLTNGADRQVLVFVRKSPEATILDEPLVSLCKAEERAMLLEMRRLGSTPCESP